MNLRTKLQITAYKKLILRTVILFRDMSGSEWLPKDKLEDILVEVIEDIEYDNFKNAMDRLVGLPYSYKVKEFIDKYRKSLLSQTNAYAIPKLLYDEHGRSYVTTYGRSKFFYCMYFL